MQAITAKTMPAFIKEGVTLVEFGADWCPACQVLTPKLPEVETQLAGKVKVGYVDCGTDADLATQYGVKSLPTMLLFVNGEAREKFTGYKPIPKLVAYLDQRWTHYMKGV